MEYFEIIIKEINPKSFVGLPDLILEKIKDPKLKENLNAIEIQWLRDHAPKLPLILKNKKQCKVLLKISSDEAITRYEIAKKLKIDKTQVLRDSKKLEEIELIYLNGRTGNFCKGRPCYVNKELPNIIEFIKELIKIYHGVGFSTKIDE